MDEGSGPSIAEIDARYSPIAPFDEWCRSTELRLELVQAASTEYEEAIGSTPASARDRTLQDVVQAAALETGAIEGLYRPTTGVTLSLIEGAISIQRALGEVTEGSSREEALIAGQRDAYHLALDVVTGAQPLSEALVREIHRVACGGQDSYRVLTAVGWQDRELQHGSYKDYPNHVVLPDGTVHAYCPVDLVASEMHRLVGEVSNQVYIDANPIAQAAFLHHGLTHIHPFSDGNGRVARVLGSIPTLVKWSTPLVVLADRDPQYRSAQALADQGDFQPFVSLIEEMTVDLLQLVAVRLRASDAASSSRRDTIGDLISEQTRDEDGRQAAAQRVEEVVKEILAEELDKIDLPPEVKRRVHVGNGMSSPPGYRARTDLVFGTLEVDSIASPARADVNFKVGTATASDEARQLVISSNGDHQFVRINEVMPRPTQALRARLASWIGLHTQRLTQLLEDKLRG
ncbi:MAG: Fic family protein [Actinomycetia bacterium]|nr:Fic family protein [Actinomycetes bacterium]